MNHARLSASPLYIRLGGRVRSLRRLSRRDFGRLIELMPLDAEARLYVTPYDVHRWGSTSAGAPSVLAIASLPADAGGDAVARRIAEISPEGEGASGWGSMVQQITIAGIVTSESLLIGGELPAEGEHRPDPTRATTPRRPGFLRRMRRAWATRGA